MSLARLVAAIDRRLAPFDDPENEARAVAALLLGHVVVWTLYASLSQNNLSGYVDMFENWAWGREFQWGYYKHPPLFAWVTGAWFHLFPRVDWAYFLLSATVSATGIAGVHAAIGTVETGHRRLVATAALALAPIWGFLAIKFNANAILLAVWPWAIWAFLRALRAPTIWNGALVGVTLALAMLGKYVSATLILAMLAALIVPAERRPLLRSPAMAAAVVVGLLVLAPHLVWLATHDFQTIRYADDQTPASFGRFLVYLVRFPLAQILYQLPILIAVAVALRPGRWRAWSRLFAWRDVEPARRTALILGLGPFVATVALAVVTYSQLSSPWGFPLWSLTGWLLVGVPGLVAADLRPSRLAALLAAFWLVVVAGIAPVVDVVSTRAGAFVAVTPAAELARAATAVWHEASGGRRLAVVGGGGYYTGALTFYSPDAPTQFIDFSPVAAPWVGAERIARDGMLAVCPVADDDCAATARAGLGRVDAESEIDVAKRWWGTTLPAMRFRLLLRLPPAGA